MLVRLRSLLLSLGLGFFVLTWAHAATTVVIVSSGRNAAYVEAAEALVGELERGGLPRQEVRELTLAQWPATVTLSPKLYVALGTEAAQMLANAELSSPVLCILLPRFSFERVLRLSGRKSSAQFSALYLDQPLGRQLDLIRLALPTARRIGVLWGPESQEKAPTMKTLAQAKGLELLEASVRRDESIFPSLKIALEDADLLLAMADPKVYNSSSIQNILLASFRAQVPMMAFSPAYVRAGALLSVHVTPTQVGLQAAAITRSVLQGKALSSTPLYSRDFQVAINEHVARALGLVLDAEGLRTRLLQQEGVP